MKKVWLTSAGVVLAGAAALATLPAQAFWGNWGSGGPWYGGPWHGGPWYGGYPHYGGWGSPGYGGWGSPGYGGWGSPGYGGWGYPGYGGWGGPWGGYGYPSYGGYPYAVAPAAPATSTTAK